ncbi:hypothetical protein BGW36DRAFT_114366 [Talaromyces proteolyticus]|uniref:Uncharacterized protein n=1 Tax=Talaromyces proteolyticus TaxID=1131652 RepID=A0AAD4Q3Z3_9EURO|nr:uncharacterized protein BGW36DRAFT_114366 [Talaromyces proteolyticus]KAH8702323.1 hypothetical protein BGW36DRAFT_114366 [Talaromyces proteolyticus]
MRIIVHAQVQWQLFTALYPLFKHSLPQIRRSSSEDQDLRIQNAITTIRHHLLAIPLQLQQVQLNQDLPQADFDRFLEALIFLLNVFERLVEEDVCQHIYNLGTDEHDTWSRSQYPKLTTLKNLLLKSRSGPATADSDTNLASDWHEPTESSSDILSDLGKYINFHGSKSVLEYQYISREIRGFNSKIKDIFHSSLGTSDDSLGNAFPLRDDEINFIRRAHRLNLLSSSLFALLGKSIACSKAHTARLHLSGFLDPDLTFDLHIAACEKRIWNCAKWSVSVRQNAMKLPTFSVSIQST